MEVTQTAEKHLAFEAKVRRCGKWWAISIPELPGAHSQAESVEEIEPVAKDMIGLYLDVDPNIITVTLTHADA